MLFFQFYFLIALRPEKKLMTSDTSDFHSESQTSFFQTVKSLQDVFTTACRNDYRKMFKMEYPEVNKRLTSYQPRK